MGLIKNTLNNNTVLLSDFNLEINKEVFNKYQFGSYFDSLDTAINEVNYVQLVDFITCSKTKMESNENHSKNMFMYPIQH
jgi:hypothetical protein